MRIINILLLLSLSSSCAILDEVTGKKAERDANKEKALEEQRKKEQEYANKVNLPNTVYLKIGQEQEKVMEIFGRPGSVSAEGAEINWHYKLLQYESIQAPLIPFKITFKDNKIIKFGTDQEQIERDKAQVLIQKDMAGDKSKKD